MQTEGMTLPCGCPGSQSRTIAHEESAAACNTEAVSRLSQWPVQIKLVPTRAPYFDGAKLLIAADCTAYAYAAFHENSSRDISPLWAVRSWTVWIIPKS